VLPKEKKRKENLSSPAFKKMRKKEEKQIVTQKERKWGKREFTEGKWNQGADLES